MTTTATDPHPDGTVDGLPDPYGQALVRLAGEGALTGRAGDYLVAVLPDHPSDRYEWVDSRLTWRLPAPDATVRVDVAVADAIDGRFVPGLTIYVAAEHDGRTYAAQQCPFRWHPTLHRYATDLRLPAGTYDLVVRIGAAGFARDNRTAGRRYADPVTLRFPHVQLAAAGTARTAGH